MFGRIVHGRRRASSSTTPSRHAKARPRRRSRTPTWTPPTLRDAGRASSRRIVKADTGRDFPSDPLEQLDLAIKAVFASWFGKRAHRLPQEPASIPHDLGTAVNVVTMVFGNMGDDSGTGVAFTRDPNTGEKVLYGEYLTNAQGEDVVAGIRTPPKIAQMRDRHARGLRRVPGDRRALEQPLPRRPGPRVHDRARPAVHAPDAQRPSGPRPRP